MNHELLKELSKSADTECGWSEERFARLIIEECIDTILDSSIEYTTRPQIARELKEHFGVNHQ